MFEAAKLGASPEQFPNLEAAIGYIAGTATHAGEVRPWTRHVDTKVFLIIGRRVQPPKRSAAMTPPWLEQYASGQKTGYAQALMAYADYYGVDGSADDDPEIEERIAMHRQPLVGYASRTGTRRNLAALKGADWRLLVSAKGELRTEGFARYALDNGAWTAYQQGQPFDEYAVAVAVERLGERADWLVLPDIVMGGMASLDYSLKWLERLRGMPCRMLIAVQNGMQVEDLASLLSPAVGIFIGGSTEWKEQTAHVWGSLARRRHCYLHVGRVNSARRIRICAAAGADSFDGTSVSRYAKTLPRLDRATRQADMFAAAHDGLEGAQRATADLLI